VVSSRVMRGGQELFVEALARKRGPLGYLARELSTELPPLLRTLG
jgi:hypothetical protein